MVSNGLAAMNSMTNDVEILAPDGSVLRKSSGSKDAVARAILAVIQQRLIERQVG